MADLIDRQAAIEVIDAVFPVDPRMSEYTRGIACGAALAKTYVEQLPSVETESVRQGHWVYGEDDHGIDGYRCDKCGFFVPWDYTHKFINFIEDYNYCPHCNARMDLEDAECIYQRINEVNDG